MTAFFLQHSYHFYAACLSFFFFWNLNSQMHKIKKSPLQQSQRNLIQAARSRETNITHLHLKFCGKKEWLWGNWESQRWHVTPSGVTFIVPRYSAPFPWMQAVVTFTSVSSLESASCNERKRHQECNSEFEHKKEGSGKNC